MLCVRILWCGCMFEKGTELHYLHWTSRWHCAPQHESADLTHFHTFCVPYFCQSSVHVDLGFTWCTILCSGHVTQPIRLHRNTGTCNTANQIAWVETLTGPFLPKPLSLVSHWSLCPWGPNVISTSQLFSTPDFSCKNSLPKLVLKHTSIIIYVAFNNNMHSTLCECVCLSKREQERT